MSDNLALKPHNDWFQTSKIGQENGSRTGKSTVFSNGSYSVELTADGSSRSCWNDIDVSHWRFDPQRQFGMKIFVRDCETGATWQPNSKSDVRGEEDRHESGFSSILSTIDLRVEDTVDAEVRRVTLVETSGRARRLEITSYLELALAPHGADLGHPAFSKLFVETDSPRLGLLTARRRRRTATERELWAAHLVVAPDSEDGSHRQFETSRSAFVGRQGTTDAPEGLNSQLTCSRGSVLDPIFCHRASIVLGGGQQQNVFFAVVVGNSEDQILNSSKLLETGLRKVLYSSNDAGVSGISLSDPFPLDQGQQPHTSRRRFLSDFSSPLEPIELVDSNGFGGFTPDGREYVIDLFKGQATPAPWINVIANPCFGMTISESGSGCVWAGNSQQNRLTPWSNDPVNDPPGDVIYIRDESDGSFWSVTARPIRDNQPYRAKHGQGYTVFEHNCHGLEQELSVFVPNGDGVGEPVKVQRLRITNRSSSSRKLSATAYVEWVLGFDREISGEQIRTSYDVKSHSMQATNLARGTYADTIAFLSACDVVSGYTADRSEFLGGSSLEAPAALTASRLSGNTGVGLDPCGALRVAIDLRPGESREVMFLLGEVRAQSDIDRLFEFYSCSDNVEQSLTSTRAWWDNILGKIAVRTPDGAINRLLNRWLLYQDLSCRIWGRTAFYQSGGAFGFRDQLQDTMALVYACPDVAREHILRASARQYREGDVQHWWHPDTGIGVRTRISDDLLWLPYVTANYVRITGDTALLQEETGFVSSPILAEHEHERVESPSLCQERAAIIDHCVLALKRGATRGAHGLPLIGGGDWNDGFNKVGEEGRGESVWLAWFLIHALKDTAEMLTLCGRAEEGQDLLNLAEGYRLSIEEHCWDGNWYVRAFFDDGSALGSDASDEAKIDSLAQSWAAISGAGDLDRTKRAIDSAARHLVNERAGCVMLFAPPFDKSVHDPGYIKGYVPGVRENGGQYTHGSLWLPMAFARIGDGDSAVRLLNLMNPVNHSRTEADALRYCVEPYVVAADVYSESTLAGRGGWTWYTGSAGWMYRVWIEEVLGLRKRGSTLEILPVIPSDWPGFEIDYMYGDTIYRIQVENPPRGYNGVASVEVDGVTAVGPAVPLLDDGIEHRVKVKLGREV